MSLQTSTTVFSSDPILVLETLGSDSSQEDKGQRLCLPVIYLRVSLASNRALLIFEYVYICIRCGMLHVCVLWNEIIALDVEQAQCRALFLRD